MREKRALRAFESAQTWARTTSENAASSPSPLRQNCAACLTPRAMRGRSDSPYLAESSAVSWSIVAGVTSVDPPSGAAARMPASAPTDASAIAARMRFGIEPP